MENIRKIPDKQVIFNFFFSFDMTDLKQEEKKINYCFGFEGF